MFVCIINKHQHNEKKAFHKTTTTNIVKSQCFPSHFTSLSLYKCVILWKIKWQQEILTIPQQLLYTTKNNIFLVTFCQHEILYQHKQFYLFLSTKNIFIKFNPFVTHLISPFSFHKKGEKSVRNPGIEPGSPPWKGGIITIRPITPS